LKKLLKNKILVPKASEKVISNLSNESRKELLRYGEILVLLQEENKKSTTPSVAKLRE